MFDDFDAAPSGDDALLRHLQALESALSGLHQVLNEQHVTRRGTPIFARSGKQMISLQSTLSTLLKQTTQTRAMNNSDTRDPRYVYQDQSGIDAGAFRTSRGQMLADMAAAISRATQRNL